MNLSLLGHKASLCARLLFISHDKTAGSISEGTEADRISRCGAEWKNDTSVAGTSSVGIYFMRHFKMTVHNMAKYFNIIIVTHISCYFTTPLIARIRRVEVLGRTNRLLSLIRRGPH
jgi:hypothetical protein